MSLGPLWLDEDQSFSLSAYVESPGPQRVILQGYITQRRADGLYAAPLIPQLFYGADGNQLQTWNQNLTSTGSQVILSRSGGQPKVPRQELFWRKVSDTTSIPATPEKPAATAQAVTVTLSPTIVIGAVMGILVVGAIAYIALKS